MDKLLLYHSSLKLTEKLEVVMKYLLLLFN